MRPSRPLSASTGRSFNRMPVSRPAGGHGQPEKTSYGQYDRARMRVRAASDASGARPPSATLAEREQRRLIERETTLLLLRRDLSRWNLEKQHRELRVRELRCTRELQATLHAAERAQQGANGDGKATGGSSLRTLHGQAIHATRRLSELEDEWTALRSSEPCVRAIDARLRVDELKRRCEELRAKLHTAEEQPPASEVETLEAQHADLLLQEEAAAELDEMEGGRERRRFEVLLKSVNMLDWQLEKLVVSQEERQKAQLQEAARNAHAHRFAMQCLQMELDAAQPLLLIAKSELGRLQQSDPAAASDGTAAQQEEELRKLEEEQAKQKADEAKVRQEVDGLRQKLKDLEKEHATASGQWDKACKDEREQKQQLRAATAGRPSSAPDGKASSSAAAAKAGTSASTRFTSDDQKRLDELRARLKVVDAVRATTSGKK